MSATDRSVILRLAVMLCILFPCSIFRSDVHRRICIPVDVVAILMEVASPHALPIFPRRHAGDLPEATREIRIVSNRRHRLLPKFASFGEHEQFARLLSRALASSSLNEAAIVLRNARRQATGRNAQLTCGILDGKRFATRLNERGRGSSKKFEFELDDDRGQHPRFDVRTSEQPATEAAIAVFLHMRAPNTGSVL